MKTLREKLNKTKDRIEVKEGETIFYKTSGIFGEVSEITDTHMHIEWEIRNGKSKSVYRWQYMEDLRVADPLLDDCFLCENENDKLFLSLKYGTSLT